MGPQRLIPPTPGCREWVQAGTCRSDSRTWGGGHEGKTRRIWGCLPLPFPEQPRDPGTHRRRCQPPRNRGTMKPGQRWAVACMPVLCPMVLWQEEGKGTRGADDRHRNPQGLLGICHGLVALLRVGGLSHPGHGDPQQGQHPLPQGRVWGPQALKTPWGSAVASLLGAKRECDLSPPTSRSRHAASPPPWQTPCPPPPAATGSAAP